MIFIKQISSIMGLSSKKEPLSNKAATLPHSERYVATMSGKLFTPAALALIGAGILITKLPNLFLKPIDPHAGHRSNQMGPAGGFKVKNMERTQYKSNNNNYNSHRKGKK